VTIQIVLLGGEVLSGQIHGGLFFGRWVEPGYRGL
jgi:hypothetical protein